MRTREEINENCPEGFRIDLGDIIDGIEEEVNRAKEALDNIKGVDDLYLVAECRDILREIGKALY